jgi:HD-like signal output (HDOD) protein/signal transduction histidine kinase
MSDPHNVFNNLKVSGNLPSMPQVLVQLLDSCHDPDIKLQAIAHIVDKDAAISAKLLQLVNSAFIGTRKAFTNIEQAVVHLGVDTVRNLTISIAVQQVFRRVETNGLLSIDRFWYHSYLNALLAQKIATAIGYPDPSEAYLAGLLHDIGKLLMWMAFPGKYAPLLLKGVRCHNGRLAFLEDEKLHVNHCEAGSWLCEQWRLPALLGDAIRYHHHPVDEVEQALPLTKIACLADLLSHTDTADQDCLDAADRFFRMSPQQVSTLSEGVEAQVEEIAGQLGIRIPRSTKTSHDQEPESQEVHKETSLGLINRIRDITQLNGLLDNLLRAENTEEIITTVEQGLKILFNEDTCLILLRDAQTGEMRCHASADNKLARETGTFAFSPERQANSLPGQAVQQRRMIHSFMKAGAAKSTRNILDAQLLRLLGTEGMAAIPLIHRDEVQGLILIGLMETAPLNLNGQWAPMHLLANHAAVALYLERMNVIQAEQLAAERVRSASMVAKKVAHEINNPLAILRNYIHIIDSRSKKGEPIHEELAIIDHELERIGDITLDLEDLAHERTDIHLERVDLHQELEGIVRLFRASLPEDNRVTLTFTPWEKPLVLRTDAKALRQIMQNLLGNARDAVDGLGSITVRTAAQLETVVISVEDNGPGIDPSLRTDLFKEGISTKNGRHGGLGLAIVHKLAEQMGGSVACESSRGATVFALTFPL